MSDLLIPLRNADGEVVAHAVVDSDAAHLAALRWYRLASGYVVRVQKVSGKRRMIYLHRAVAGLGPGRRPVVDHDDGDKLNNRRANLRVTTQRGNGQNRGANKGRRLPRNVYRATDAPGRFRVQVKIDGCATHLGVYDTVEDADVAARAWRVRNMPLSPDAKVGA